MGMSKLLIFCWLLIAARVIAEEKDFSAESYFIKKEYIARGEYHHHDDTNLKDEYQNEVYLAAYELAKEQGLERIADIGCGSGYKLLKYFGDLDTTGFEIEPTLSALRKMHPFNSWSLSDFSRQLKGPAACYDLLICSDVIEHVVNPDDLLNWINNQFTFQYLVLSTPDRDQLIHIWKDAHYGPQSQSGPPVNWAHVREWSFSEFEKYISQYFEIVSHFHCKGEFYDQVIIAKQRR
jgi:hypothetical protein